MKVHVMSRAAHTPRQTNVRVLVFQRCARHLPVVNPCDWRVDLLETDNDRFQVCSRCKNDRTQAWRLERRV